MKKHIDTILSMHAVHFGHLQRGFTLIELLVVVALIGALAVALIATVDPFEQLKKGNDATRRTVSLELYNSLVRYYSQTGTFPWSSAISAVAASDATMTTATTGYLQKIVTQGELKPQFLQQPSATLGKLLLTANGGTLSVCYLPESKAGARDPNARYTNTGGAGTSCLGSGAGASVCYWCVQ